MRPVSRSSLMVLVACGLGLAIPPSGQNPRQAPPAQREEQGQGQKPQEQEPAEEDSSFIKKEYAFNPLQAIKEVKVGNFYLKKGSYKAAAGRFEEATKWNPGLVEAWLRLAETEDKLKDEKAAREAWTKYLELEPNAKNADAIRKRLGAGGSAAPAPAPAPPPAK